MKKLTHLFVATMTVALLLVATGLTLDYKSALAYFPTNTVAAFTPTGYATLNSGITTTSVALGTNGTSTPQAVIAVVQNLGSNLAYVTLGASSVAATTTTGYPVLPSQTAVLTIRNSTHLAAITGTGSSNLSIITGY